MDDATRGVNVHRRPGTDLYRFYDISNRLLYVGISLSAAHRASQHRGDKPWWDDVARMEVQHLDCPRRDAEAMEKRAIIAERPKHNIVHQPAPPAPPREPKPARMIIEWMCEVCGQFIKKGAGYIQCPTAELQRYEDEMAAWREEYPDKGPVDGFAPVDWTALFAMPDKAHWTVVHRECDPLPDDDGYWFGTERALSAIDLLQWTAHLMEKDWLDQTDWQRFIHVTAAALQREPC